MNMQRGMLLSGLMVALIAGQVAAQGGKLYPVDESAKDASFKTFRGKLLTALRKKDKEFILSILDPKIQLSFGGESGIKDFKRIWKIDQPNSQFWREFTTVIELGGTFQTIDGQKEFVAPYVTSRWPDDPKYDAFEYVAVLGTNVRLRSTPGVNAPILTTLSYDIVKLVTSNPPEARPHKDGFTWVKVMTGAGVQGFVADKYVRSAVDYRAYFRKVNGSWILTVFIAGD